MDRNVPPSPDSGEQFDAEPAALATASLKEEAALEAQRMLARHGGTIDIGDAVDAAANKRLWPKLHAWLYGRFSDDVVIRKWREEQMRALFAWKVRRNNEPPRPIAVSVVRREYKATPLLTEVDYGKLLSEDLLNLRRMVSARLGMNPLGKELCADLLAVIDRALR